MNLIERAARHPDRDAVMYPIVALVIFAAVLLSGDAIIRFVIGN